MVKLSLPKSLIHTVECMYPGYLTGVPLQFVSIKTKLTHLQGNYRSTFPNDKCLKLSNYELNNNLE